MAIPALIQGAVGLATLWMENKKAKSQAKNEREVELIKQSGSWEDIHAKGSQHSWKDEYWTIIFSIPLIFCFVPGMEDHVRAGFDVLQTTPEWYRWTVGVLVGASVGIRQFDKFKAK